MSVLATVDVRSGPRVVLREAVRADVPVLVSLLAQDQLGAQRDGIGNAADLRAYEAAFREIDRDPAHLLVVAEAEAGAVAGTMQLSFLPGLARRGSRRAQIEAVRVAAMGRPAYVTSTVADILGSARTFRQWIADHAGGFSPG